MLKEEQKFYYYDFHSAIIRIEEKLQTFCLSLHSPHKARKYNNFCLQNINELYIMLFYQIYQNL